MTKQVLFLSVALAIVTSTTLPAGPAVAQGDAVSQAEKVDKSRVGIAETKDIAEEGYIYGLPIVMN